MKSVLVTGGTVRIGAAISRYFSERGWKVLTSSHRGDSRADIVADLSGPTGVAQLYSKALELLGGSPPDVLVNNAALFTGSRDDIDAVNRSAPEKLTILMAGRETGRGAVVNILDSCVFRPAPEGDYEISKAGLMRHTRKAALLFADTLRVNAVAPGPVLPPVDVREKAGATLLGKPAPEDVAAAVFYLAQASATTGCVIPVDGGQALVEESWR